MQLSRGFKASEDHRDCRAAAGRTRRRPPAAAAHGPSETLHFNKIIIVGPVRPVVPGRFQLRWQSLDSECCYHVSSICQAASVHLASWQVVCNIFKCYIAHNSNQGIMLISKGGGSPQLYYHDWSGTDSGSQVTPQGRHRQGSNWRPTVSSSMSLPTWRRHP